MRSYSFDQITEWVERELVPESSPAARQIAWDRLRFQGDLTTYFQNIRDILCDYPTSLTLAHTSASRPFGPAFMSKVQAAQVTSGAGGLTQQQ